MLNVCVTFYATVVHIHDHQPSFLILDLHGLLSLNQPHQHCQVIATFTESTLTTAWSTGQQQRESEMGVKTR